MLKDVVLIALGDRKYIKSPTFIDIHNRSANLQKLHFKYLFNKYTY